MSGEYNNKEMIGEFKCFPDKSVLQRMADMNKVNPKLAF